MVKTKLALVQTRKHQCPTCNRIFESPAALLQHRMATHGLTANPTRGIPPQQRPTKRYDGTMAVSRFDKQMVDRANQRTQTPQQVTPQLLKDVISNNLGSTPTGRAWAMAAIHPCGAGEVSDINVGELLGMADTMTGSVANPIYRSENHLRFNKEIFVDGHGVPVNPETLGTSTYGVDLIIPPIPEIVYMYRLIDDGTGIKSPWVVVRLPDFNLPAVKEIATTVPTWGYDQTSTGTTMASTGYGKARIIGRGLTIELDAAALNDQGRIVVGQMQGQITPLEFTVPFVTSSFTDFVTDVGPPVATAPGISGISSYSPGATTKVQLLSVPTDPAVITSNCPAAYQGLAKNGAYVVQKFSAPLYGYEFKTTGSHLMYDTGTSTAVGEDTSTFLPYTALAVSSSGFNDNASLQNADDFWVSRTVGTNPLQSGIGTGTTQILNPDGSDTSTDQALFHPFISNPSDMMTSVVTLRNLPSGVTNGTTASLRIKGRTYLECISNGSNPAVSPYVHSPAEFDVKALHQVIVVGKRTMDAYPAAANSLGGIFGSIWNAIKNVGRPIAKAVKGFNIPVVSDIASGAMDIVDTADSFLGGLGLSGGL